MSDLQIPDAADDLWFECGCQDKTCDREGYQKEALPFIVAAELRRLADEVTPKIEETSAQLRRTEPGSWAYRKFEQEDLQFRFLRASLHARADELDGGAS